MTERSLLLVGCGKMGGALLTRWRKSNTADIEKYWVIEPNGTPAPGMKAFWIADLKFLPKKVRPSVIVFAVKPQQLASIMPAYRKRFGDKPLYISIAAGKPISFFTTHFGGRAKVVRAMPNTPALIGKAMTVLCASASVSVPAQKTASQLMSAVGKVVWVKDENMMDAVTALSGSGPAYVFLFLDALVKAAVDAGLPADVARTLAIQTVSGSCALAAHSKESFEELREQVTSPGGTTEAALSVLLDNNQFEAIISSAIRSAVERARELSR